MAAELGSTRDPKALIPGNPEAIEDNVRVLRTRGQAATDAGDGLRGVDTGAWGGPAATAFHDKFSYEPPKWHTVGDALVDAATALTGYADTLRWAQTQAAEAIRLWEAGQRATEQARARHNASVEQANQQNRANAAAGNSNTVQVAPFTDPGEQQRQAARDLLQRARQQLTEAGDRTTEVLRGHTRNAPEGRDWLDELGSVAEGAWEGVQGILEFAWDHSPLRLVVDPKGFFEDKATLAQSLLGAVQNPVEFAKAAIDWDTWQNNPARAAGRLLPDALIAAATAGAGGAAIKAGKTGGKAAEKAADTAEDAAKVEKRAKQIDHLTENIGDPKKLDPEQLNGMNSKDLADSIPSDWKERPAKRGDGMVYEDPNNRGRQIRIMNGYENRPDPVTNGPYVVVSQGGGKPTKIPLEGNPTLEGG